MPYMMAAPAPVVHAAPSFYPYPMVCSSFFFASPAMWQLFTVLELWSHISIIIMFLRTIILTVSSTMSQEQFSVKMDSSPMSLCASQ
ncbi:hypothetical protein Y032_0116g628 [Ancylostoma ceylanicum]|uniref:Uncharacterized protein n=1 Tax=Ancylostoma ceylanicum TaxID=53326 RepID=A0A016TCS0_9BILA|nr:hypothetical protein Y032_0116g628 [Ancylostoma ceylanicum]